MARNLRSADELIMPGVNEMIAAIDPPAEDAPLVRLARTIAAAIDAMPAAARQTVLPQHSGQLVKVLTELDRRAQRRGQPASGPPNRLQQLRAARAANDHGGGRGRP